jgi:hypothetical protein
LEAKIKEFPIIGSLLISIEKAHSVLNDINNKQGAMYLVYQKVKQIITKKGE